MSQADFGSPSLADGLLVMAEVYLQRGLALEGLRAFLSGFPDDHVFSLLQVLTCETRARIDSE